MNQTFPEPCTPQIMDDGMSADSRMSRNGLTNSTERRIDVAVEPSIGDLSRTVLVTMQSDDQRYAPNSQLEARGAHLIDQILPRTPYWSRLRPSAAS
jgi:hypothetical protein